MRVGQDRQDRNPHNRNNRNNRNLKVRIVSLFEKSGEFRFLLHCEAYCWCEGQPRPTPNPPGDQPMSYELPLALACVFAPLVMAVWCGVVVWRSTAAMRHPVDASTPYGAFGDEPREYL